MKIRWCELRGRSGHEAGRELLMELYREEFGTELPEIVIAPMGKPCFSDGSAHFSISHTARHAFCALSNRNIGIDAEELDRKISLKLADKILSSGEKTQFDAAQDKSRALLTFWVLKEAEGKRTGEGVRIWPDHTDFSLTDPRVQEIDGCLVAILEDDR